MKRRDFLHTVVTVPAGAVLLEGNVAASPIEWRSISTSATTWPPTPTPVATLRRRDDDILLLHVKDRKRDNGPNLPFGQGDTPIRETLRLLRDERWRIPANIEWEVDGDRVTAVRQCLDYCRQVLES